MTPNAKFRKWMDSMPYGKYSEVRQRIIKECIIKESTYANWRSGACSIPPLAQEKIKEISEDLANHGIGYKIIFLEEETIIDF